MKEYIHSQWTKASRSLAAAKAIVETDPDSRLRGEGIADKELSALLARDLLIPIVHGTTYEALREVSPLLGSRSGLSTSEDSMANVSAKIAELVAL